MCGIGGGHVTQACHAIRAFLDASFDIERVVLLPDGASHRDALSRVVPRERIHAASSPAIDWLVARLMTRDARDLDHAVARLAAALGALSDCFGALKRSKLEGRVDACVLFTPFLIDELNIFDVSLGAPHIYVAHHFADHLSWEYGLLMRGVRALAKNVQLVHMRPGLGAVSISPLLDTGPVKRALAKSSARPPTPRILVYSTSYGEDFVSFVLREVLPRYERDFDFVLVGSAWPRGGLGVLSRSSLLDLMASSSALLTTSGNEMILEARLLGVPTAAMPSCARALEQVRNLEYYESLGYCERLLPSLNLHELARRPRCPDAELMLALDSSAGELVRLVQGAIGPSARAPGASAAPRGRARV